MYVVENIKHNEDAVTKPCDIKVLLKDNYDFKPYQEVSPHEIESVEVIIGNRIAYIYADDTGKLAVNVFSDSHYLLATLREK